MTHLPIVAAALAAAVVGSVGLIPGNATANPSTVMPVQTCATYADLSDMLVERFGERPATTSIANDGTLVQVFASKANTWTMVNISPQGKACVVAVGHNWQELLGRVLGWPA